MASVVDICNLALSHLGANQSVEQVFPTPEQSTEARTCHLHYQPALDAILAEHDWGFARVTRTLALAGTAPGDWTYSYAYPSDCIAAREIVNETKASTIRAPDKIPFDLGYDTATKVRVIYTDQAEAVLRYTVTLSNTTRFTPTSSRRSPGAWPGAWPTKSRAASKTDVRWRRRNTSMHSVAQ